MDKKSIFSFAISVFFLGIFFTLLLLLFDSFLCQLFIPIYKTVMRMIYPVIEISVEMYQDDQETLIQAYFVSVREFENLSGITVPAGLMFSTGISTVHSLFPMVVFLATSAISAHSTRPLQSLLCIISPPLLLLLQLITTPFLLLGQFEIFVSETLVQAASTDHIEWNPLIGWMIFLEGGGTWFISILLAAQPALLAHTIRQWVNKMGL